MIEVFRIPARLPLWYGFDIRGSVFVCVLSLFHSVHLDLHLHLFAESLDLVIYLIVFQGIFICKVTKGERAAKRRKALAARIFQKEVPFSVGAATFWKIRL